MFRLKSRDYSAGYLRFQDLLNFFKLVLFRKGDKRNCRTGFPGSTGSAYTVNIIFRNLGEFKIYNMTQIMEIDSPGGNIGCYQSLKIT